MVHQTGLEPARDFPCAPKAHAYTYSATGAYVILGVRTNLVRMPFPAVSCLPELRERTAFQFYHPADNFYRISGDFVGLGGLSASHPNCEIPKAFLAYRIPRISWILSLKRT